MNKGRFIQPLAVGVIVIAVLSLFTLVYRNYIVAKDASWQQVSYRVMDSMLPFQERFHAEHQRYAVGVFDRSQSDASLTDMIDWRPSVTDSNRYVAHVIGNNSFTVTATSKDGRSLCRMYPPKQACFDLKRYLPVAL